MALNDWTRVASNGLRTTNEEGCPWGGPGPNGAGPSHNRRAAVPWGPAVRFGQYADSNPGGPR